MKNKHTELLDYIINPSFLELMKQPTSSVEIQFNLSFKVRRQDRLYRFTFYVEEGQVNISLINENGLMDKVVLTDYCKTPDDFRKMLEKLDDLSVRFPKK